MDNSARVFAARDVYNGAVAYLFRDCDGVRHFAIHPDLVVLNGKINVLIEFG